ncbi:MAG: GAF domain-containing protein [Blastocatellia bacterium]
MRISLETVAHAGREVFSAVGCLVIAINPITGWMVESIKAGEGGQAGPIPIEEVERTGILREAFSHEIWQFNQGQEASDAVRAISAMTGFSSFAAIAIRTRRRNRALGILCLGFAEARTFSAEEMESLRSLARQAATVLRNTWYLRRYQEVVRIGQDLNQQLETHDTLFRKLCEDVADILDVSSFFMLAVYQPQSDRLDLYMKENGNYKEERGVPIGGVCEEILRTQHSFLTDARSKDPKSASMRFEQIPGTSPNEPESMIFVPLSLRGAPLGVLSIQHPETKVYQEEDLKILKLLGNQVALALSSLRLFEYLRNLDQMGQELTQQLSLRERQEFEPDQLLQEVVERIHEATRADLVILFPYRRTDDAFDLPPRIGGDLLDQSFPQPREIKPDDMVRRVLAGDLPHFFKRAEDLYASPGQAGGKREGKFEQRENIRSVSAIPLRAGSETVGVLFVNFRRTQRFDAPQRHLISTLASYAATAIINSRAFQEVMRRRIMELELLREIDHQISKSLDLNQVLQTILEMSNKRLGADDATLMLHNPRTRQLEAMASLGAHENRYLKLRAGADEKQGIVVRVFNSGTPVRVGNVNIDPEWRGVYRQVVGGVTSELCVPLMDEDGEIIGVINLESAKENAFTKHDEEFLTTLAGQAVLAVKNAQLYERERETASKLTAVREVEKAILHQQGNPQETIQLIIKNLMILTDGEIAGIHLYERGTPSKTYYIRDERKGLEPLERDSLSKDGIVEFVARTQRPYLTTDAGSDEHYRGEADICSEIAVPLVSEGRTIGVLNLESRRESAFDQNDLLLLEDVAKEIVIAIQTADRFNHAREESDRFRLLLEAGQELGTIADPAQIDLAYEVVTRKIHTHRQGEIVLRRFDTGTERLIRVRVYDKRTVHIPDSIGLNEGVNGQVARERRTIHLPDADNRPDDVDRPMTTGSNIKTLLVCPILFKNFYYGNVVFSHEEANYCSDADVKLIEGLAQQLAITIHRLDTLQSQIDAEMMSEVGVSAYELTHRLGNELGLVRSYVNNIRRVLADAGIETGPINEELEKLLKDVGNVLSMSKGLKQKVADLGEQGRLAKNPVRRPVRELLEEARWSIPQLPANIRMSWDVAEGVGETIVVPGQILDILYTLVANAKEAMADGGEIHLRAKVSGAMVQIEVADTGPGIPPDNQEKIFNLFFSTKKSSGFGLWSARRYARANRGDLSVRSQPGQGATFVLQLPLVAGKGDGPQ